MYMRTFALILALAAAVVLLAACSRAPSDAGPTTQSAGADSGKPLVGVTLLTRKHQFYRDLEAAMKKAAADEGLALSIQSADFDVRKQTDQVETFLNSGVKAIVICPADSKAIVGAVKSANQAGVPVFTADITALGGKVVSHIASDNVMGGRVAGEYMGKLLGGKGKIIIIDHPITTSVQDRVRGFKEAIAKFPGIKIVAQQTGEGERTKAMAVMETMIQAHPDLNGVFAINDDSALGALAALKQAKRTDVAIVGYDATPEAREAILAGTALKADSVQHPDLIGDTTIRTIARYLKGEQVPKLVPIEVGIVDKASLTKEAAK